MSRKAKPARRADGSFLTGSELSAAICHVLGGSHPRCAVAFWGKGSTNLVDRASGGRNLRIVCDISMGGCHPDALRSLGAPDEADVRYHDGLHAKVYLSCRGVVVGSANASDNGIGFGYEGAALVEAGTFHVPASDAWTKASNWFDALHSDARQIDEAALERADRLFRPRRNPGAPVSSRPGSLLDIIVAEPDRFAGIGFVLASTSSTEKERADARKSAVKAGIDRKLVKETSDNDMFVGWGRKDVLRWPTTFIELWMPKSRLYLYARTTLAMHAAKGNVFTRKSKRAVGGMLPGGLPDFREAERQDAAIVARLLTGEGQVFRTAAEFAAAIDAVTD